MSTPCAAIDCSISAALPGTIITIDTIAPMARKNALGSRMKAMPHLGRRPTGVFRNRNISGKASSA